MRRRQGRGDLTAHAFWAVALGVAVSAQDDLGIGIARRTALGDLRATVAFRDLGHATECVRTVHSVVTVKGPAIASTIHRRAAAVAAVFPALALGHGAAPAAEDAPVGRRRGTGAAAAGGPRAAPRAGAAAAARAGAAAAARTGAAAAARAGAAAAARRATGARAAAGRRITAAGVPTRATHGGRALRVLAVSATGRSKEASARDGRKRTSLYSQITQSQAHEPTFASDESRVKRVTRRATLRHRRH
jgi:hypothetical protein